jgi:glycosyltransferase involved in cell wall biosynthesis
VNAVDRVAVILGVRDGERYLAEAIDSALGQTRPPDEVVVVDDGSRDGTAAVADGYGPAVRCIRRQPEGPAAALNVGVEATTGELIGFLDSDDLWNPRKLELQCEAFDRDRSLDMVFGGVEQFVSPELGPASRAGLRAPGPAVAGKLKGTMLVRRSSFERVGPFDPERTIAEFVDWYARAMEHGLREEMLPAIVLRRRLHEHNLGRTKRELRTEYARVLGAALKRRSRQPSPEE